ncbi:RDD family protein [Jidongwangia harbinensis]|uniref:RDD family protein n=1 Tax=Jidongwangia harbinensis TaxID=2878561 RepID=UPI001CD9B9A2|nr:RDD family protein [Jidongwangia harbinensis]MCA2217370.1 RDD family protein [Jidongwangia harbinensis]
MPFANWYSRVAAYLIDGVVILPFYLVAMLAERATGSDVAYLAALLVGIAANGYNRWWLAGRTGQSWGRRVVRIRLVAERTEQPIGPGRAFLRDLAHILDDLIFYLGYLFPLWTAKRQTLADKVMRTVVLG